MNRASILRRSIALEADMPKRIRDELEDEALDPALPPGPELRQELDAGRSMIVLLGAPGTGKTLTACLALVDRGFGHFITAPHYAHLLSSFKTSALAERAADRTMLVLDDLGEESERNAGALAELLTHRYNLAGAWRTVITSNFRPAELAARYGTRLLSRLEDPRHSAIIYCSQVLRPRRNR